MRNCYLATDKAVGELIDDAGAKATVMVLGGPGMRPLVSANLALDEIARRLDLGLGAPFTSGQRARNAYKSLFPHTLRIKLAPIARRARQIVADRDYKSRRFFAVPHNDNSGGIRVNLKGREKYGRVAPGPEYDAALEEIREKFLTLKNAETGAPAVIDVVFTHKFLKGPYVDDLPDAFVLWDRECNQKNLSAVTSEITGDIKIPPHLRTGDHTSEGCFWSTDENASIFAQEGPHYPEKITQAVIESLKN